MRKKLEARAHHIYLCTYALGPGPFTWDVSVSARNWSCYLSLTDPPIKTGEWFPGALSEINDQFFDLVDIGRKVVVVAPLHQFYLLYAESPPPVICPTTMVSLANTYMGLELWLVTRTWASRAEDSAPVFIVNGEEMLPMRNDWDPLMRKLRIQL